MRNVTRFAQRPVAIGVALALVSLSVFADGVAIVSEGDIGKFWSPIPGVARIVPGYPRKAANQAQDVCVTLGYLIDKNGSTSEFTELKVWSSSSPVGEPEPEASEPFVRMAAAAVSTWKMTQVSRRAKPIFTSATFSFVGSKTSAPEKILANCQIDDLKKFISEKRAKSLRLTDAERNKQRDTTWSTELPEKPAAQK